MSGKTLSSLPDERYQQIMEAAGFVIFESDAGGNLTFISESVEQLVGYTPQELIGESFAKLVHPDSVDLVQEHAIAAQQAPLEFAALPRDGSERWCEVIVAPVRETEGGYLAFVRDITERRQADRQVRENEQRFRGLFDHNNDAVFFLSLDGNIEAANGKAANMLGYEVDDLAGTPLQQYIKLPHTKQLGTVVGTLLQGETVPIFERTLKHSSGTLIPVEMNNTIVYNGDGKPSHVQTIVHDITERKQTQQQLAERIDQLTTLREVDAEMAERLDVDYVLTMAVDSALRLSGADIGVIALLDDEGAIQQTRLVGDYPLEAALEQYRRGRGILARAVKNLKAEFIPDVLQDEDYVVVNPRAKAKIATPLVSQERLIGFLNLESNRRGMFNEDRFELVKMIAARIATAIDNSHLYRQTETQLVQLRDLYAQVSKLEQLKTDMIRIASHDLRNPLSAISGFIELIKMDIIDDVIDSGELIEFLKNMDHAVKRMQRIITDILSLERIEESISESEGVLVNMNDLVQQVVDENKPQASLHSRRLSLTIEDPQPLNARGQAAQLQEAMFNLIGNAIKYTPQEGRVDVILRRQGGRIIFEVKDNGFGIPEPQQEKLFQPFYRAKSKETESIEGTGLGLHLVKKIIERHNGKMIFNSVYGKGSTFGFSLPWAMD